MAYSVCGRGKLVIAKSMDTTPKKALEIPSGTEMFIPVYIDKENFDTFWRIAKNSVEQILNGSYSHLNFDFLNKLASKLVTSRHGEIIYNNLRKILVDHVRNKIRGEILKSVNGDFLSTFNTVWHDYSTQLVKIGDIFSTLHKYYVPETPGCHAVYKLGVILFRDEVYKFGDVSERLRKVLIEMLTAERDGKTIDRDLVKNVSHALVRLGIDGRLIYEQNFEVEFLKQSADYYRAENENFLAENTREVYVHKLEARINEEVQRVRNCLYLSTEPKIVVVMIDVNMKTIQELVDSAMDMLIEGRTEDLKCLYNVLKRMKKHLKVGLHLLASCFSKYIHEQGRKIFEETDTKDDKKPLIIIENLLDLKSKCDKYLKESFNRDRRFRKLIGKDFGQLLSNAKAPEYMSLHMDEKLRKGIKGKTESEVEEIADKCMILFRFLQEKDIFERYYKQHLAKRLLLQTSLSDDAEKVFLLKFKNECGAYFTSKLEKMFQDIESSAIIMDEYRRYQQKHENDNSPADGLELTVRVLTTGYWPTQSAVPKCILPQVAHDAFEKFKRFYTTLRTSGRNLTVHTQLGGVDLLVTFCSPSRKYILCVSIYQMCVLMLFNKNEKFTYEEIAAETEIVEKELKRTLQSLLAASKTAQPILCRSNDDASTDLIKNTDVFTVNDTFTSRLNRVKIQTVASKRETEPELVETRTKVDADRSYEIEAAIVRLMKAEKRMSHNLLVAKTIDQLKHRFIPAPDAIKKRIDNLLSREYLSRDEKDKNFYNYVA